MAVGQPGLSLGAGWERRWRRAGFESGAGWPCIMLQPEVCDYRRAKVDVGHPGKTSSLPADMLTPLQTLPQVQGHQAGLVLLSLFSASASRSNDSQE